MEMFAISIIVMVSRVDTNAKTYQITHFRYVQFIAHLPQQSCFLQKNHGVSQETGYALGLKEMLYILIVAAVTQLYIVVKLIKLHT